MGGLPQQLLGMVDQKNGAGAAGNVNADIQPNEHEIWVINSLEAYHDDPAGNLTIEYNGYDGSATRPIGVSSALAANASTYFYNDCPLPQPWVITYDHYIRLVTTGIAAGKKTYWRANVTIFKGLPTGWGA